MMANAAVMVLLYLGLIGPGLTKEAPDGYDPKFITDIMEELQHLRDTTTQQNNMIIDMKETIGQQQEDMRSLLAMVIRLNATNIDALASSSPEPEVRDQYQSFGCIEDTLSMSCPDNRNIIITHAYYGQWKQATACGSGSCCAPNPYMDCKELMAESETEEWVILKYLCDNKTSCSYVYDGAFINDCETSYVADYMEIFYSCIPYDDNELVAFTALATIHRDYDLDDIVLFDATISNIGNHYNIATSTFVCPYSGVYLISISVYAHDGEFMYAQIMRNDQILVASMSYGGNYESNFGAVVLIEAEVGDIVWVKCQFNDKSMESDSGSQSHFSGVLIQRNP